MKHCIMCEFVPWLAIACAAAAPAQESKSPLQAREPPKQQAATKLTPAERYRDTLKAHDKAIQEFMTAYRMAKTDEERQKVIAAKRPDDEKFADQMFKIIEDAPKDPVAVEALVWVSLNTTGPKAGRAMKILIADHVKDPGMATLCERLAYDDSPQSEAVLRKVLAENPGSEARAQACLALGQRLKTQSEQAGSKEKGEAMVKEAETFLDRATIEFKDVKSGGRTVADIAGRELNEIRNLGIGKTPPDVTGEDVDGKRLKLTDFRGKVVVLDFWGDW